MGRPRAGSKAGKRGGTSGSPRPPPTSPASDSLPPPPGLTAYTFSVDEDEYALLAFELPELELPPGLSPAERDVVRAVAAGQSNAAIAKARGTSANTVANQLRSIYAKLKVSNRMELVRRCAGGSTPDED